MKKVAPLLIGLFMLTFASCDKDSPTKQTKTFNPFLYEGLYVGTWTNSATGATGPARMLLEIIKDSSLAKLTLDFDGNYLGLNDPPPATLTGTYNSKGAKVTGTNDLFGEMNVTVDVDGNIIGTFKNLIGGLIPEMTYTAILTSEKLDADYIIKFADGTVVNSILRLHKQK